MRVAIRLHTGGPRLEAAPLEFETNLIERPTLRRPLLASLVFVKVDGIQASSVSGDSGRLGMHRPDAESR
ncbi:MAG: hypothetical protein ACHQ4J_06950 [Candidatus Binatia bacterium]